MKFIADNWRFKMNQDAEMKDFSFQGQTEIHGDWLDCSQKPFVCFPSTIVFFIFDYNSLLSVLKWIDILYKKDFCPEKISSHNDLFSLSAFDR